MTKSTITRERLEKIKSWRETYGAGSNVMLPAEEAEELARMALAEKASEPVILYRERNPYNGLTTGWQELTENEFSFLKENAGENAEFLTLYRHAQPASEYPKTLPCPVLLEPGLRFGKGIKTSTMLAALARRAVYESDMAALSPEERAEFQARIDDFKALVAQPAPVVPEEWTIADAVKFCKETGRQDAGAAMDAWNACRAAMLAAAPQSPGSEPATVPGKWIPVSEQMPPSRHEVLVGRWWGEKPRWCCKWATYIPGHPDAQSSGWLIPGASWTPTHWMPLPAGPQGVKGE
ncbi:DUF551 domain-containing protein [Klebsiella pneumoniae]|nr:DUF551 domain-containing protein [Klebsiella pneumoniae]